MTPYTGIYSLRLEPGSEPTLGSQEGRRRNAWSYFEVTSYAESVGERPSRIVVGKVYPHILFALELGGDGVCRVRQSSVYMSFFSTGLPHVSPVFR